MIQMTVSGRVLTVQSKWFCSRPAPADSVHLVCYRQSAWRESCVGFVREPFCTLLVNLSHSEAELLAACNDSTRYGIRRAERDGIVCDFAASAGDFIEFYARIARAAGRIPISARLFESAGAQKAFTIARRDDRTLAMHSYVIDRQQGRVCLWHSATLKPDGATSAERALAGRANRLLHLRDMLHFRQQGFTVYDFGGYATDPEDSKTQAINRFKDGFGGRIVEESHFYSYGLYAAMLARQALGRLKRRTPESWGVPERA